MISQRSTKSSHSRRYGRSEAIPLSHRTSLCQSSSKVGDHEQTHTGAGATFRWGLGTGFGLGLGADFGLAFATAFAFVAGALAAAAFRFFAAAFCLRSFTL